MRLIVRRVKPTPGSQLALFATYSYHGFITGRDGETLELEAGHRRHAEIENAIRDLKYGVGLNRLPSGRFAANAAWLAVQVMAHNLARWTARLGLGERTVTTKTLRRRFFALAGRLTRKARRLTLPDGARLSDPPSVQLNFPANSRHPGPRAPLAVSYPAISLTTAAAGRHRCPQKRLQTARQPPVYTNSSPDHRACNSLTPLPLSSRRPSVDSGLDVVGGKAVLQEGCWAGTIAASWSREKPERG